MTEHHAPPGRRAEQITRFYQSLERTNKGRLTKLSQEKWCTWLSAEGIGRERAKQIMQGRDDSRKAAMPVNVKTVLKYTEYLERYGYVVTAPVRTE